MEEEWKRKGEIERWWVGKKEGRNDTWKMTEKILQFFFSLFMMRKKGCEDEVGREWKKRRGMERLVGGRKEGKRKENEEESGMKTLYK